MKKVFTLMFFVLSVTLMGQITTNGLVRYYPFTGNPNDSSVNVQHGTVHGANLTTNRFGVPNSAYEFNGTSDFIEIPMNGLFLNQYTYAAWAEAASVPALASSGLILSIGTNAFNNPLGGDQVLAAANNTNVNRNGWGGNGYNTTGPNQFITYEDSPIVPNEWNHITLTRSGNVMKFYLNCVLVKVDSFASTITPKYGNAPQAKIGSRQNNTMFFHGKIDEVRIYDRALTDAEIETMCLKSMRIKDELTAQVRVYPNPTDDIVFFELPENDREARLEIYDTYGRTVSSELITGTFRLSVAEFKSGLYFYRMESKNNSYKGKLIVQ